MFKSLSGKNVYLRNLKSKSKYFFCPWFKKQQITVKWPFPTLFSGFLSYPSPSPSPTTHAFAETAGHYGGIVNCPLALRMLIYHSGTLH